MEYGSRNGGDLRIGANHGSERANDFHAWTDGKSGARKPGKEAPNEGKASRAKRPGDEKGNDEPG